MNFKFFSQNNIGYSLVLEPMQQLTLTRNQPIWENVEFCFQFDDGQPIVFGSGATDCNITLNRTPDGNITFNDNGRVFKLFARERQ